MPCIWGRHDRSRIFIDAHILSPEDMDHFQTGAGKKTPRVFKALIDTGATSTCITRSVAARAGLEPIGKALVRGVSGIVNLDNYLFHVGFAWRENPDRAQGPSSVKILQKELTGAEIDSGGQFDVLIGMDILSVGSLAVEGNGTYSFSF